MRISTIRSLNTSIEFKGVIVSLSLPFVLGRILNGFGLINGDTILYVMILVSTLLLITIRHSISSQIGGKEQDGIMLLTSVVILFSFLYVIFFVEFGDFMYDETMGTLFVTHNILSILAILYIPYKRPELVANRDSDWDEHFLNRTATVMLFTILLINSIRLIGFTGITGIFILLIVATGIVRSLFIYNPNSLKYKAISSVIVFELITILITIMMYIDQFSPNLI